MSKPNTENQKAMASLTMLVSWVIWNEKNARVFRKKSRPPFYNLKLIQEKSKLWVTAGARHLSIIMPREYLLFILLTGLICMTESKVTCSRASPDPTSISRISSASGACPCSLPLRESKNKVLRLPCYQTPSVISDLLDDAEFRKQNC